MQRVKEWGKMMQQAVLTRAVEKLASAGEQAGISVEDIIRILQAGVSVEALVDLIERNLPIAEEAKSGDFTH